MPIYIYKGQHLFTSSYQFLPPVIVIYWWRW